MAGQRFMSLNCLEGYYLENCTLLGLYSVSHWYYEMQFLQYHLYWLLILRSLLSLRYLSFASLKSHHMVLDGWDLVELINLLSLFFYKTPSSFSFLIVMVTRFKSFVKSSKTYPSINIQCCLFHNQFCDWNNVLATFWRNSS